MSYRDLKSYEQATIIYDFTMEFVQRYIPRGSRTRDQMEQAARSGKQNIAEGSANPTSQKSELHLLGIARASFEELLADYEDFLRQRNLETWSKDSKPAQEVRGLAYGTYKSYTTTYRSYLSNPETAANAAICLIHQVNFLLDRQIKAAETKFVKEGGYTESLRTRREEQKKKEIVSRFWRKYE